MRVKASVLTYRESEMTLRCLGALRDQVDGMEVVSNGSDGSAEAGLGEFSVVTNPANEAFSTCINGAARRAWDEGFEGLLFVTNDVTFKPGVVDRLRTVLAADEAVAGVMPMQVREGDEGMVHHAGGSLEVGKWKAILEGGGEQVSAGWDRDAVEDRDWIDGGGALYRLSTWDSVGEWRPEYGFYGEDVDWGYRAWQAGLKVQIDLGARVTHRISGTASRFHRWQRYLLARNRALGARLNLGSAEFQEVAGYLSRTALVRVLKHPWRADERVFWAGIRAGLAGVDAGVIDPLRPVADDDPVWREVLGWGAR